MELLYNNYLLFLINIQYYQYFLSMFNILSIIKIDTIVQMLFIYLR